MTSGALIIAFDELRSEIHGGVAVGWIALVGGGVALLGINVWRGGPWDSRLDEVPPEQIGKIFRPVYRSHMRVAFMQFAILSALLLFLAWNSWKRDASNLQQVVLFGGGCAVSGLIAILGLRSFRRDS